YIIISDDDGDDDGCAVDGNGGASSYQTLENDSDNLQVETEFPGEHTNVSDGDENDFQSESMSCDTEKASEGTSEESKSSSEEESVED
ncbi:hypothetical protein J0J30_23805, partial [Vibrio vulnificus]|nr:hypothetical protein [Vibrio vulnificus]